MADGDKTKLFAIESLIKGSVIKEKIEVNQNQFNSDDFTVASNLVNLKNKTSYWTFPANAARVYNNATDGLVGADFTSLLNNGQECENANEAIFVFPVTLPHGAVITGCIVYGEDTGDTWTLNRAAVASTTPSAMASAAVDTADTTITNATIDNENYCYYIIVGGVAQNAHLESAKITYTTDYD